MRFYVPVYTRMLGGFPEQLRLSILAAILLSTEASAINEASVFTETSVLNKSSTFLSSEGGCLESVQKVVWAIFKSGEFCVIFLLTSAASVL